MEIKGRKVRRLAHAFVFQANVHWEKRLVKSRLSSFTINFGNLGCYSGNFCVLKQTKIEEINEWPSI